MLMPRVLNLKSRNITSFTGTLCNTNMAGKSPAWRNAPDPIGFRSYSGPDSRLHIDGDELRLEVRSAKNFVLVFGTLFLPAFALVAWYMIPDRGAQRLFAIGGTAVGLLTFGLIYFLLDYHQRLGDYLVVDRKAQSVRLPRSQKQFPLDQVFCLQIIRGRSKSSAEVETDLNLLVAEGNQLTRYHILGSPSRQQVDHVSQFAGLPVEVIDLGWKGLRDADGES
jgi:hypothetical protein